MDTPDYIMTEDLPNSLLENDELIETLEKWEKGLEPVTIFIPSRAINVLDTLCVVLQDPARDPELMFHCYRYMRGMGEWDVSVDGQGVDYKTALGWIPSPRAL